MDRLNEVKAVLTIAVLAIFAVPGCAHSSPLPTRPPSAGPIASHEPTYVPLPQAPRHVDFARITPRFSAPISCAHLPIPGYTWERLDHPDCWDEDFGVIRHHPEEYSFIVGWRASNATNYLISSQPNEAIDARKLPGMDAPLHFAAVRATDLCLARLGSSRVVATFDWRTGRYATRPVARCATARIR